MNKTMGESVPVSRPRPSHSCVECRRRKVRCTKEKPVCLSCMRMNQKCIYTDEANQASVDGKRKPSKTNGQSCRTDSRDRAQSHENISGPRPPSYVPLPSSYVGEQRTDFATVSEHSLTDTGVFTSPSLACYDDGVQDGILNANIPTSNSDDIGFSYIENLYSDFPTPTSCCSSIGHQVATNAADAQPYQTSLRNSERAFSPNQQAPALFTPSHESTETSHQHQPLAQSVEPQNALNFTSVFDTASRTGQAAPDPGTKLEAPGYLSIQDGARVRHVGPTFWAYVKGYEPQCEAFLGSRLDISKGVPHPYIDSAGLSELLNLLPPKPTCNTFLYSFLVGVRPIYPLVHVPTLQVDYSSFWHWYENQDTTSPPKRLREDPTFLCLLFSILCCGAATASPSLGAPGVVEKSNRDTLIEQLKNASTSSLRYVQHLRTPTFNTLVAALFRHNCLRHEEEGISESKSVGAFVRIAQGMGLHIEMPKLGFDAVAREMRRRVWWHILWLDFQSSIFTGTPPYCYNGKNERTAQMVSEASDKNICDNLSNGPPTPSAGVPSAAMVFAIGRFETARFQRFLINRLQTGQTLEDDNSAQIQNAMGGLERVINDLIAKLPAQGAPEEGWIPSRIMKASPLHRKDLYGDHTNQPTVFTSWARIMLTMFKTEAAILLHKISLEAANGQSKATWSSIAQSCIFYLRNFLQIIRVPSFAPYTWFTSTYSGPLQSVLLLLTYVQNISNSETEVQALYLVDEVIDFFLEEEDDHYARLENHGQQTKTMQDQIGKQSNPCWKRLRRMRENPPKPPIRNSNRTPPSNPEDFRNLFKLSTTNNEDLALFVPISAPSNVNLIPHYNTTSQEPLPSPREQFHPPSYMPDEIDEHGLGSDGDLDIMLGGSDLHAWSTSLLQPMSGTNSTRPTLASNPESRNAMTSQANPRHQQPHPLHPERIERHNEGFKRLAPTLGPLGRKGPLKSRGQRPESESGTRNAFGLGRMTSGTTTTNGHEAMSRDTDESSLGGSHKISDFAKTMMSEDLWDGFLD